VEACGAVSPVEVRWALADCRVAVDHHTSASVLALTRDPNGMALAKGVVWNVISNKPPVVASW